MDSSASPIPLTKSARNRARKAKKKNSAPADLADQNQQPPPLDHRFGYLSPAPAPKLNPNPNEYSTYIDADNVVEEFLRTMSLGDLKRRIRSFLKRNVNDNRDVDIKLFIVGDEYRFMKDRSPHVPKDDVFVLDIYPRKSSCTYCHSVIMRDRSTRRITDQFDRLTDAADIQIAISMILDAKTYGLGCNIGLVSGDVDFKEPLKTVTKIGHNVFLLASKNCSSELAASNVVNAQRCFHFKDVV